jgi:N-acylneuraminate cytidylyltransferase/CMP-N,N'-diacetyllegionaminic acid synthase
MRIGTGLLAVIPARRGSKGVPGKNLRVLAGLPLVAHAIRQALRCRAIERCIVSTDSEEIAAISRREGAEVPFRRPASLGGDRTTSLEVILHALRWLEAHEGYRPSAVVLLQPTSPLRTPADIDAAWRLLRRRKADAVVSVTPAMHHPWWTKTVRADGRLADFLPSINGKASRRQDLPAAYALNGAVYLARREALLRHGTWYGRRAYAYVMPPERSLDLDTAWEFHLAELIMSETWSRHGRR